MTIGESQRQYTDGSGYLKAAKSTLMFYLFRFHQLDQKGGKLSIHSLNSFYMQAFHFIQLELLKLTDQVTGPKNFWGTFYPEVLEVLRLGATWTL